jgi:hypothetical protein
MTSRSVQYLENVMIFHKWVGDEYKKTPNNFEIKFVKNWKWENQYFDNPFLDGHEILYTGTSALVDPDLY